MSNYVVFATTIGEWKANIIASSLERMSPNPIGAGILEIEDGCGLWEISGFFSEKPNLTEIKILEVVHQIEFVISKIVDKDWVHQVQRDLAPVRAGRFILYGHHDAGKVPINLCGLKIEAAMAFGTGHHATTVGCLLSLEHLIKKGYFFQNVADIGCGTGVLAMAAAVAFKTRVLAIDIDEVAVETAKSNFKANALHGKVEVVRSSGFNNATIRKGASYDLIFANILANPLCLLALNIARHTQKKGIIILSGILNEQANRVERYYYSNGFSRLLVQRIDQWTTFIMQKK